MKKRRAKTMPKNEDPEERFFKKGFISAGIMPFLRKRDAKNMKKHEKTTCKKMQKNEDPEERFFKKCSVSRGILRSVLKNERAYTEQSPPPLTPGIDLANFEFAKFNLKLTFSFLFLLFSKTYAVFLFTFK